MADTGLYDAYLASTGQPNFGNFTSSGGGGGGSYNPIYGLLGSMLGGGLGGLFGGGSYKNPASAAMPYLNQVPGMLDQYYDPYINTGLGAMNQYYGQMQNLGTPQGAMDIYNQFGAGYTQSPGYQYNVDQATKAANQVGAASGMAGTPSEQLALANQISGMAAQDYDNYMKMNMGLYNTGLSGLGGLSQQGYGASTGKSDALQRNMMTQAGLQYMGQAMNNARAAQQGDMWSQLLGGLGSTAGFLGHL
jgi:hypothetical protein